MYGAMWFIKSGKKSTQTPEVPSGSNIIFNDRRALTAYMMTASGWKGV
ncbi:hypothetical protein HDEF_2283 [Candidatus Hamiltonella defensa 5AT (Acyrthosiphon pisum)]|uniref:Uncharacterized protein n=1 Tax=Hamiltonella defensa subsp. Acyrthosiphon pisum (strain 5AT) TaxID=572265 RepID=C4K8G6_HAMD5|nr:hypothetical protein HDEF_2283 [Candidatus Hamiltonella defensa 5AT (Acyrthosiphon pisum)]